MKEKKKKSKSGARCPHLIPSLAPMMPEYFLVMSLIYFIIRRIFNYFGDQIINNVFFIMGNKNTNKEYGFIYDTKF